ncbi:MAG TPA: maleylpyruvate isomerase N-terminal domain-containing protein [Streptosporangiaceae bacterium]|nr:maleylpyruvate isomerase N-terminal domain-containing protein [Streptosporangiaceae bacterium]
MTAPPDPGTPVPDSPAGLAFLAESERLSSAVSAETGAAFARPSPCPPWTAGELLHHVTGAVGRLSHMLTGPEPDRAGQLVPALGYYRPDHRFSPDTNADRIATAQRGASRVAAGDLAADFTRARREAWALVRAAPPGRVVRTRHGDLMLLTEFLRTRVVELAAHGLDLAAALNRDPWLTAEAAAVIEDLVLPPGAAPVIRERLGWDRAALIAALTRRRALTAAESGLLAAHGVRWLALG